MMNRHAMAAEDFSTIFKEIERAQETVRTFLNHHVQEITHDQERIAIELPLFNQTVEVISKKWAIQILWVLEIKKDVIFNDISRFLQGISTRSLSDTLKSLEKSQLITRTIEDTRPPRVHYSLNAKGKGFVELAMLLVFYMNKNVLS